MGEAKKYDDGQAQSAHSLDLFLISRNKYVIERETASLNRNQRYKVKDEEGNLVCQGDRQGMVYKAALLIGLIFFAFGALAGGLFESTIGLIVFTIVFCAIVVIMLKPRNLVIYRSGSEHERIFSIVKCKAYERKPGNYAIESAAVDPLGYFGYSRLLSFFHPQMKCYGPDGFLLCAIAEPFLNTGGRWGIVAIDLLLDLILGLKASPTLSPDEFDVLDPVDSHVIGKFGRDTIELAPETHIDGRICLAIGLMISSEFLAV